MSIRDALIGDLRKAGAIADDTPLETILTMPLFTSGALKSIRLLLLHIEIEEDVGFALDPDDISDANFDTILAVEALLERYAARAGLQP